MNQATTVYFLEPESPTIVDCSHSCDADTDILQLHPTISIQMPEDNYTVHKLHSGPLRDRFHSLIGQTSFNYSKDETCGSDSLRHFRLEISGINNTRFNNSVIQCGVQNYTRHYYAEGVIVLTVPPTVPQIPSTEPLLPQPGTTSPSDEPTTPTSSTDSK